ncbi:hypothetical protein MNBD_GAMMA01-456 [hydrothermal vent metagenome]|uniref:UDP-N-acetyl-alpha-D-muramoyl-L-alanyl-L-glutamate epimerase n=1 Tax=hydrothermal vent metagenome TaxID=652676 RepID=A0A3B0V4Q8_9ZZZZ
MQKVFHRRFKFLDWKLDISSSQLLLSYYLAGVGRVSEVLSLPQFNRENLAKHKTSIDKACELVHLLCGVSYYKAGLAANIEFQGAKPSQLMSQFVQKTWFHGLAELAYVNNVSLKDRICFNGNMQKPKALLSDATLVSLAPKALVALGGGKDSLVTVEELKHQNKEIFLFMVGSSELIKNVAQFIDRPLLQVQRKIDAKLIAYNKTAKGFNGHIPITAINSAIAVLCALLYGFDEVVFSNERSADSANTINADNELVNHQYSKSYEFEHDFSAIIKAEITPYLKYYSQQRSYSELAILKKFSQYPQYFPIFSSCNRNFHIDGSHNDQSLWCCDCPKCRFVFLGLAAFIDKQQLLVIFAKNMLNDASQQTGFAELLGVTGFKPFECVGDIEESQLAYNLIKNQTDWGDDLLIKYFSDKIPPTTPQQYQTIMNPTSQ